MPGIDPSRLGGLLWDILERLTRIENTLAQLKTPYWTQPDTSVPLPAGAQRQHRSEKGYTDSEKGILTGTKEPLLWEGD